MEVQEKVIKIVSEATKVEAANIKAETSFIDDLFMSPWSDDTHPLKHLG